jgi:bisphosphoglycerate-dependent phosphoglycerate mutase
MLEKWTASGWKKIPRNGNQHKNLDCAVFNEVYLQSEARRKPVDSARAVYVPTESAKRIWERSWIYEEAHIQVNIRNQKNILAVWHVGPEGRYGRR